MEVNTTGHDVFKSRITAHLYKAHTIVLYLFYLNHAVIFV